MFGVFAWFVDHVIRIEQDICSPISWALGRHPVHLAVSKWQAGRVLHITFNTLSYLMLTSILCPDEKTEAEKDEIITPPRY